MDQLWKVNLASDSLKVVKVSLEQKLQVPCMLVHCIFLIVEDPPSLHHNIQCLLVTSDQAAVYGRFASLAPKVALVSCWTRNLVGDSHDLPGKALGACWFLVRIINGEKINLLRCQYQADHCPLDIKKYDRR